MPSCPDDWGKPRQRDAVAIAAGALCYALTFAIGFMLPAYSKGFSAVWVAGGVGLALMVRLPRRLWLAQTLAFYAAGVAANLLGGKPLVPSLGFMCANVVETLGSAWLMVRLCGEAVSFQRVRDVPALFACAVVVNAGSAAIGAGTGALTVGAPFGPMWRTWWAADGLGLLIVTPLVLTWWPSADQDEPEAHGSRLEAWLFGGIWLALCHFTFSPGLAWALHPYALVVVLCWPALRLSPRAVSVALAALATGAVLGQVPITSPFASSAGLHDELVAAQSFAAFAAVTGLLLAASQAERQHATEELRRTEERFRSVVEHTDDLVTRVDAAGRVVYVNAASRKYWGLPPEECIGRNAFDFIHPDDRDRTQADFQCWLSSDDKVASFENRQGPSPEGWHDMLWTSSVVHDPRTGEVEYSGIARDITGRKAEEERQARDKRLESVGRLAGGVGHAYNNALQAMIGHLDLAIEAVPPGLPAHDDLRNARAMATRSAVLTGQLLAFSAHQQADARVVDVNALVTSVEPTLRQLLGDRAELTWLPAGDLPRVCLDPVQFDQMLAALVSNSRDAMVRPGTVSVRTRVERQEHDSADGLMAGEYVVLSVRDDGCGISPENQAHLFEPFFTTKPVGQGTGIGLAAVHGMVKRLGGTVRVASAPGEGTTVELFLPVCPVECPAVRTGPGVEARDGAAILFVDDDDAVRRVMSRALQQRGYRVLGAASAEEALALLEGDAPEIDLVVTDIVMPGRGGHALRERLAELRPETPCLLISGFSRDAAPQGAPFLSKPFTIDALVDRIEKMLAT